MVDGVARDGSHDFDFAWGSWRIANRRLKSRLTSCTEWEDFEAQLDCWPILGGHGNVDTYRPTNWIGREGFEGGALRLYDREEGVWRIWWMSTFSGKLDVPVVGTFVDGEGTFLADEFHEGIPVTCRFRWYDITENSARWEQALSADGRETWEVNWVQHLTRRE